MRESLRKSYPSSVLGILAVVSLLPCAGQSYLKNYDPKKGFGEADKSLTTIFLKIAGSLEHHGSPEPYLKWMLEKEHPRIAAKWEKATDKKRTSRPDYLTDSYLKKLLAGWKGLEKPLALEKLCRESGRYMRFAIEGSWNKTPEDWALDEPNLSDEERGQYKKLLAKTFFTKDDLKETELFYADGGGHEKLSNVGKAQMSDRFWLGKMPIRQREEELARRKGGTDLVKWLNKFQERVAEDVHDGGERNVSSKTLEKELIHFLRLNKKDVEFENLGWSARDALEYSHDVKEGFVKRFIHVRKTSEKEPARIAEQNLRLMVGNLVVAAYSELDAAIYEMDADRRLQEK